MQDIVSHSGKGRLTRSGRSYEVEYDLNAVRTFKLRISGTVRAEMDALPARDELQVADLRIEDGQTLRIMFQHVDALNGTASFYLNKANS